jgi:hypothetical protein
MVGQRLLSGVAGLLLMATPVLAQEVGGVALSPDVLKIPDAQQQAMNLAYTLLQRAQIAQQLQQGRLGLGLAQGSQTQAPTNPNAVNPSAGRSATDQQAIAQALANRARPTPVPAYAPSFVEQSNTLVVNQSNTLAIDRSHSLVVNAADSPVVIGNGNIVRQQVANSTAISHGTPAIASATLHQGKGGKGGTTTVSQDATSTAASSGGTATSSASNSSVVQR